MPDAVLGNASSSAAALGAIGQLSAERVSKFVGTTAVRESTASTLKRERKRPVVKAEGEGPSQTKDKRPKWEHVGNLTKTKTKKERRQEAKAKADAAKVKGKAEADASAAKAEASKKPLSEHLAVFAQAARTLQALMSKGKGKLHH